MRNLSQRAMKLWGIEKEEDFDPLIRLLLDVFAYEIHRVSNDIQNSNIKLVEHLARVLVHETWSLPAPAHALMQAFPEDQSVLITEKLQFYATQFNFGSESSEYFFTPVISRSVVPARIYCCAYGREAKVFSESGKVLHRQPMNSSARRVPDFTLVVGIEVSPASLAGITELPICLLPENSVLTPFIHMAKVFDMHGNELPIEPLAEGHPEEEPHYFTTVKNYYRHFLYTIDISSAGKALSPLIKQFPKSFDEAWTDQHDTPLFWLKIVFPVAFDADELAGFSVSTNAFPVINRRLFEVQHTINKNGRIVSLPVPDQSFFMGVREVTDNEGMAYREISKSEINRPEGSYSVFYGNVEQFDENSAKTLITKTLESIREEGSAFSALGYDILNAHLKDLGEKLDEIERKVATKYQDTGNKTGERQYIVTQPSERSTFLECSYWVCDADAANNIDRYTVLEQYKNYGLRASAIHLLTKTVGGDVKHTEKEKISNLRYGLLSKDRLVSKEDIIEFVRKTLGKIVEDVQVKPGVSISPHAKQGLVRTADIEVKLLGKAYLDVVNKQRMEHFLESELSVRSIQNIPYQVTIQ